LRRDRRPNLTLHGGAIGAGAGKLLREGGAEQIGELVAIAGPQPPDSQIAACHRAPPWRECSTAVWSQRCLINDTNRIGKESFPIRFVFRFGEDSVACVRPAWQPRPLGERSP
jgi:hypothetical protein